MIIKYNRLITIITGFSRKNAIPNKVDATITGNDTELHDNILLLKCLYIIDFFIPFLINKIKLLELR
jgi:hypothetical protein